MNELSSFRHRYEQDPPAVQLGGLASNLGRIAWHAMRQDRPASSLFRESKYFTEWAAASCSMEQQALLAQVQSLLASWERGWGTRLDPSAIGREAQDWSTRLLESSSLLDE